MQLEDQVVWITGASRGIGAALATAFAAQGARLILSAPPSELAGLERTLQACLTSGQGNKPGRHLIQPFDLASPNGIQQAYDAVKACGLRVDILVHNAGITHRSMALDTAMEVDRLVMAVNYLGPVQLSKLVVPDMISQGGGRVVAVASVLGLIATPQRSAYIAAKHAMHGFFEALRTETADRGIGVLLVYPGFVNTDIAFHALTGQGGVHGHPGQGQAAAMAPETVAQAVLAALRKGQPRLLIAGKERLLVYLQRLAPSLVTRIVRRVGVT